MFKRYILRQREETNKNSIGCIDLHNPNDNNCKAIPSVLDVIKKWTASKNFDAAIWTDLPANFTEKTGMTFNEDNVISYLSNLDGDCKKRSEDYIRNAPRQVRTKMRSIIEGKLGWSHSGNGI